MTVRDFFATDFEKGFLETIASLSPVTINREQFGELYRERLRLGIRTIICLIDDKIVGTASCFLERKFLHNGGGVMHVEDVAVHKDFQKKGVGTAMMKFIEDFARSKKCYKIILDCSEDNVLFYEKNGYTRHEVEMRKNLR